VKPWTAFFETSTWTTRPTTWKR